jgi:hypothetical protein
MSWREAWFSWQSPPGAESPDQGEMSQTDPEAERGYLQQLTQLHDTTLPRARYILDQQRAILRDTPFNRGCIRATAEYIRAFEAEAEADL